MRRSSLLLAAGWVLCRPGLALAAETRAAEPSIPVFADPQRQIEKPDLSRLGPIRFVTGTDYPPFDVTLQDGTLAGYNIDLARLICTELGLPCTIQGRPWSDLKAAVLEGKADAAIASIAIDPRAPGLGFTTPYFRTPARFVIRGTSDLDRDATPPVGGKRVAVESGTAHERYLATFFPKAVAVPFPDAEAARAALKAGSVDALFADATATAIWLGSETSQGCCSFWGGPFTEPRFFGRGAGIAVAAGNDALRRALDYALARLAATGATADLYLRYFPVSPY